MFKLTTAQVRTLVAAAENKGAALPTTAPGRTVRVLCRKGLVERSVATGLYYLTSEGVAVATGDHVRLVGSYGRKHVVTAFEHAGQYGIHTGLCSGDGYSGRASVFPTRAARDQALAAHLDALQARGMRAA